MISKIVRIVTTAICISSTCFATDTTFSWLPNGETDLAGYKIHYGQSAGEYTDTVDCGMPDTIDGRVTYTVTDIPDGHTFFACTAYDDNGQSSDYSDVLQVNPNPAAPAGIRTVSVNVTVIIN